MPQVALGVIFHWLGGLASGSFYVPYKAVKKWSWEVYWLMGGFFSWIIAPLVMGLILTDGLFPTLAEGFRTAPKAMQWAYLFGMLWGIGGLTFGLTMRYLGMSLGMAVALGLCTVLGTLMPDIVLPYVDSSNQTMIAKMCEQPPYVVILLGLGVCLLGVILAGIAGMSKEREMPDEVKKETIKEFNFAKGLAIALISGLFSACMAFGIQAAKPLADITMAHGTEELWSGLPKLVVVLWGGFTTNFIWCMFLLLKNRTLYQFAKTTIKDPDEPGKTVALGMGGWLWNFFFSALAGTTWYFQFFFYSMGETKMDKAGYGFSSWTLHMASIIIFSSIWGLILHEWRGSSKFTKFILGVGIFTLIYSTIVVGYGNLMGQVDKQSGDVPAAAAELDPGAAEAAAEAITNAAEKTVEAVGAAANAVEEFVTEAVETAVPSGN